MVDAALLHRLLAYDPATGIFRWRVPRGRRVKPGDGAGFYDHGYIRIGVGGRKYYAHQLAWLLMKGRWADEIDHYNGQGTDNRWHNLHDVSHAANSRNQRRRNTNTSGATGIQRSRSGSFYPYIMVNGRKYHLGTFFTFEAAVAARQAAQVRFGFSKDHGHPRRPHVHSLLRRATP